MAKNQPTAVNAAALQGESEAYVYQPYPKHLYNKRANGDIVTRIVKDQKEHAKFASEKGGGWKESPADFDTPELEQIREAEEETVVRKAVDPAQALGLTS